VGDRSFSVSDETSRGEQPSRSVIDRIARWIDPSVGTKGVVYGTITVGAVIAIDGSHVTSTFRMVATTALVLLLYFAAHVYAEILSRRFSTPGAVSSGLIKEVMRYESGIVRGASIPVLAMAIPALFGLNIGAVQLVGLAATVLCLVAFEVLAGIKAKFTPMQLVVQAAIGVGFGVGIIVIRWVSA